MPRLFDPLVLTLLFFGIHTQLHAQSRRSVDDFNASVTTLDVESLDLTFPQRDVGTVLNSLAIGGETDILLNLVEAQNTEQGLTASIGDGRFRFTSDPGTKLLEESE